MDVRDGIPYAALIARRNRAGRIEWCLPKGHLEGSETPQQAALREVAEEDDVPQMTMDSLSGDAVAERLRALQVDTMTPIEALNALYELKKLV